MKKTLKKVLSLALAIISIFTLSLTAFAFSIEEAKAAALKDAGFNAAQVNFIRAEYDREDKNYEVDFKVDGIEYDYDFNKDGKIIGISKDFFEFYKPDRSKDIGKDAAKEKAFAAVGAKSSSARVEYDREDHEYEVNFSADGKRYEVTVSADGTVLEQSWEGVAGAGSTNAFIAFFQKIIEFFRNLFKF